LLSLFIIIAALTLIAQFVYKMKDIMPGKFNFNLPLFFLHLFIMILDTGLRFSGVILKYKTKVPIDPLKVLQSEVFDAKLSIFYCCTDFVL